MSRDPLPGWLRAQRLEIGQRLRAERRRAKITQEELAHRAGFERTSIVRIEGGHSSPRLDRLLRIARVLGIPPGRLFPGGPGPPDAE